MADCSTPAAAALASDSAAAAAETMESSVAAVVASAVAGALTEAVPGSAAESEGPLLAADSSPRLIATAGAGAAAGAPESARSLIIPDSTMRQSPPVIHHPELGVDRTRSFSNNKLRIDRQAWSGSRGPVIDGESKQIETNSDSKSRTHTSIT